MKRMTSGEYIELLKTIDLFESFSDEDLRGFAETISEMTCVSGETLCREGGDADNLFILLEGRLQVFKEKRKITQVEPVNYVGEMALIEEKRRSATVVAIEPCRLLRISAERFYNYFSNQPKLLVSMLKTLSGRIRRDTELMAAEFEKTNILIHDMKNCLSIFLFLDLLKFDSGSREARYVKFMTEARRNLGTMMREALANAKRNSFQPVFRSHSLSRLIKEVIETTCRLHPDCKRMKVEFVDDELPDFLFSKGEIRRVLVNLLLNAAQASGKKGHVEIVLRREGDRARVDVKDFGPGIPEDNFDKIFLPHFTTKSHGNGLGLPSCRQIIEDHHNGSLRLRDNPEGGAIFSFTLPLLPPA